MKRIALWLGIIQTFVAIGAIPAGLFMIFEPEGSGIGMSTDVLLNSPFQNFLIPGLFLFFVNGLCNVLGAFLSFRRNKYAGIAGVGLAGLLILWIGIQVYFIGLTHFLQPTYLVIGIIELIVSYGFIRKHKLSNRG